MKSIAAITALVMSLALPTPGEIRAQTPDLVGMMRDDSIVVPLFSWTAGEWTPTPSGRGDPPDLQHVSSYFFTDSAGRTVAVSAGELVRLPDGYVYEDPWGQTTNRPSTTPASRSPFARPVGYALTDSSRSAPFLLAPDSAFRARADSLVRVQVGEPHPRQDQLRVLVWSAGGPDETVRFFQILRYGFGCSVLAGWLGPDNVSRIEVAGRNDCEGKGVGALRPWLRLWRDGQEYVLIEREEFDAPRWEMWQRIGPSEWTVVAVVSRPL